MRITAAIEGYSRQWNALGGMLATESALIVAWASTTRSLPIVQVLFERGVLCLPGFVTNSGGVLGGTMEFASVSRERIAVFIRNVIGDKISFILEQAADKQVLPRQIAVPIALDRFQQVQQAAAHPTLAGRVFELGMALYRRGWIPGVLVGLLSLSCFKRTLA